MPAAKPEPYYDVFVSYRRQAGDELALLLQRELQRHNVPAFLDRDLGRGVFDDKLLRRIAESPTFLIVLTPNALDRCSDEEDWLRKEIIQALSDKRNIIPLLVESFQFTAEAVRKLDPAIRELSRYQAVVYSRDYFESTIERIVKMVEEDKVERQEARELEAMEEKRSTDAGTELNPKKGGKPEVERPAHAMARRLAWRLAAQDWLNRARKGRGIVGLIAAILVSTLGVWLLYPASNSKNSNTTAQPTATPTPASFNSPKTSNQSETIAPGTTRLNSQDGLSYTWIPPGTFQMGCSSGDNECADDEKPAHPVTIKNGFWLGQTLVTQAAYRRVKDASPSNFYGDQLPVESVSWNDAKSYCEATRGRLPTEAEWEYAARAGRSNASRYGGLGAIAWYDKSKTNDVAQLHPNPWKLYDMLGNVWEWVEDWYDDQYYANAAAAYPRGPAQGLTKSG